MNPSNTPLRALAAHLLLASVALGGCSFPTAEFALDVGSSVVDAPDVGVRDVPPTDVPTVDVADIPAVDVPVVDVPADLGFDAPDAPTPDAPAPDADDAGDAPTPDADDAGGTADVLADGPTCPTGQSYCGDACVDIDTSATHCGRCGNACTAANAASVCAAGACAFTCNPGYADCDGVAANGCEANLATAGTCGSCMNRCNATNGTAACTAGACAIACNSGFGNCDGNAANGCETNLQADPAHCGACPTACANTNGTPTCAAGACGITCAAGFGNCDGSALNGCEANLSSDAANCRTCSARCGIGQSCVAGSCTTMCPGALCGGVCVDTATSVANCGGCGRVCPSTNGTARCMAGSCAITCNTGFADCDATTPGCETNTQTNATSCGTCNNRCTFANASGSCVGGACLLGACNPGFGNCDGVASNGCETDLRSDVSNCGACSSRCAPPNAFATCSSGVCGIVRCNTGFTNCDGAINNGCEVNTGADVANCGACGNVCRNSYVTGRFSCMASACTPTCNPGYASCDGNPNNGCEASLNTNSNCGGCGRVCPGGCGAGGACGIGPGNPYAQQRYRFPPPTLIDACAVAGRTTHLAGVDDSSFLIPIPFATRFWYGSIPAGSMINVSSNGWIGFNGVASATLYGLIPDPAAPNSVVAPYWTDLVMGPTGICIATIGVAPGRRWIVEWSDAVLYSDRSRRVTFEVIVNEGGSIEFYYGAMAAPQPSGNTAAGIENQAGNDGIVLCNPGSLCTIGSNSVYGWYHL